MCSVFWLFWLSCQYLPSDWLERPLWGSLRGSSPESPGRRVLMIFLVYCIVSLFYYVSVLFLGPSFMRRCAESAVKPQASKQTILYRCPRYALYQRERPIRTKSHQNKSIFRSNGTKNFVMASFRSDGIFVLTGIRSAWIWFRCYLAHSKCNPDFVAQTISLSRLLFWFLLTCSHTHQTYHIVLDTKTEVLLCSSLC